MPQGLMLSEGHQLDAFFSPRRIALIGATSESSSAGHAVWENLRSSFPGKIFAVGSEAVAEIPAPIDLTIFADPPTVEMLHECGAKGTRGAVIIPPEVEIPIERHSLLAEAHAAGIRLLGPDSLGVMTPSNRVNATFARGMAKPGNIAFVSQSGAMCSAVLDWSLQESVGFSAFAGLGTMLDVGFGDLIDYLGQDYGTHAILIYMETIGDARRFLSAAREAALTKPIIVLKAGQTESDEALDAAFRRCGVLRVNGISELFYMVEVLSKQPRPQGPKLTILTNAGGPALLATDALIANGGELAELSPTTTAALDQALASDWSHGNPIDITGDATPDRYKKSLGIAAKDSSSHGLLVILTPQAMTDPTNVAESLKEYARIGKPVLASWMGGSFVAEGEAILNGAGIPTFPYPDTAARMFQYMWRYTQNLRSLYETPSMTETEPPDSDAASRIVEKAHADGRTELTNTEAQSILAAYRINGDTGNIPIVLRSFIDPQFGPVLEFGLGGPLGEILKDRSLGLPPLNTTLARRMMERTKISASLSSLEKTLVRFSQLVVEQRWISEIEIDPLGGADARIVLHPASVTAEQLPRIAIRPYPSRYVEQWIARDSSSILFRPIRPEDEPLLVKFHESVSDQSVYLRYFQFMKLSQRVEHERLTRICFNDYDREIALVAVHDGAIIGVGRLRKTVDPEAEIGILIIDSAQGKGLGTEMVRRLIDIGRHEGVTRIIADVHSENSKMLHLVRNLGFKLSMEPGDPVYQARLVL